MASIFPSSNLLGASGSIQCEDDEEPLYSSINPADVPSTDCAAAELISSASIEPSNKVIIITDKTKPLTKLPLSPEELDVFVGSRQNSCLNLESAVNSSYAANNGFTQEIISRDSSSGPSKRNLVRRPVSRCSVSDLTTYRYVTIELK